MRYPNYSGGSCYYAGTASALEQIGYSATAKWLVQNHSGGAWLGDIRQALDRAKINYVYTDRGDWAVIEYANRNNLMAAIEFKNSHACTFVDMDRNNNVVRVLDNNHVGKIENWTVNEFYREWIRQGGRALVPLGLPLPPAANF